MKYKFKTKPYEHQLKALEMSWNRETFAYFMEMGTGKTKVLIDNMAMLYDKGKIDGALIIAPKGVIGTWHNQELPAHLVDHIENVTVLWQANITKSQSRKLGSLFKTGEELHILIMNIEAFSTQKGAQFAQKFMLSHKTLMVIDESTTIKNPKAKRTKNILRLADRAQYRRILTGAKVTGFKRGSNSKAVTGVVTSKGTIDCEQVIVGVGPWIKGIWDKLELPKKISIKDERGKTHKDYPMWIYWFLTEGVLGVDPNFQKTDDGKMPPVIHVDSDAHLFSDVDGSLITDKMWGIYYKPDFNFKGVQGGAAPYKINKPAGDVKVDPYGVDSEDHQTGDEFAHMWCSALAHCQKRFKGKIKVYKKGPSGGLGCFTPDSFPIFDRFCENVYIIADSNHGYKMMGVGKLVAEELLENKETKLLKPFRFNRYAKGELHPTSHSPFPWS